MHIICGGVCTRVHSIPAATLRNLTFWGGQGQGERGEEGTSPSPVPDVAQEKAKKKKGGRRSAEGGRSIGEGDGTCTVWSRASEHPNIRGRRRAKRRKKGSRRKKKQQEGGEQKTRGRRGVAIVPFTAGEERERSRARMIVVGHVTVLRKI